MLVFIRLLIIASCSAILWLGWIISPDIISPSNMRYLGGLFLAVWGMAFHFLQKSSDLSALPGLNWREQERLVFLLAGIRKRIWWMGGVGLAAGCLAWFIGSMPEYSKDVFAPLSIGFLIGVSASYLFMLPKWFDELYAFVESVRLREDKKKRAESILKQIAEGKKLSAKQNSPA